MKTTKLSPDHTEDQAAIDIPDGVAPDLHLAIKQADASYEVLMSDRKSLLARVSRFTAVEDPNDTVTMADAKALRLLIVKNRTALDRTRKTVGETFRLRWQAINETFKPLLAENEDAESFLKESEDFLVNFEASRKAEIRDARAKELAPYTDPAMYQLGDMTEEQWQGVLAGAKFAHNERLKAEAAQKALEEEQRLAGERERALLAAENQRLRERQEAERAAAEKQRQKDAEILRAAQDEARREAAVAAIALASERERTRKIEEAAAAKLAAEKKAADEEKKARAKAARAPDKQKLKDYVEKCFIYLENTPTLKGEAELILYTFSLKLTTLLREVQEKIEAL